MVPSGCSNRKPQPGRLLNSQRLLITVLEAGRAGSECQHARGRALFPSFSLFVVGWKGAASSVGPFYKGTDPRIRALPA